MAVPSPSCLRWPEFTMNQTFIECLAQPVDNLQSESFVR